MVVSVVWLVRLVLVIGECVIDWMFLVLLQFGVVILLWWQMNQQLVDIDSYWVGLNMMLVVVILVFFGLRFWLGWVMWVMLWLQLLLSSELFRFILLGCVDWCSRLVIVLVLLQCSLLWQLLICVNMLLVFVLVRFGVWKFLEQVLCSISWLNIWQVRLSFGVRLVLKLGYLFMCSVVFSFSLLVSGVMVLVNSVYVLCLLLNYELFCWVIRLLVVLGLFGVQNVLWVVLKLKVVCILLVGRVNSGFLILLFSVCRWVQDLMLKVGKVLWISVVLVLLILLNLQVGWLEMIIWLVFGLMV